MNWPRDPTAWLTPAGLLHAWVAEHDGTMVGHVGTVADHQGAAIGHADAAAGAVVGSASAAAGRAGVREPVEVTRLFVAPAARRLSVARDLLRTVIAWAGPRPLTLEVVDEGRSSAIAFYEATGWRLTSTSTAGWTTPDGRAVHLRRYTLAAAATPDTPPT